MILSSLNAVSDCNFELFESTEVYMNTFKLTALTIISLASFNCANLQANVTIPGASYGIYALSKSALEQKAGNVEFYTFDGNLIMVLQNDYLSNFIASRLDKNAPKPRPVSYKIEYRNTFKRPAGYWMVFYDKNGNIIAECRCDDSYSTPFFIPALDLSIAKKMN